MKINKILIILMITGISACSNKGMYDTMRNQQRNACLKSPATSYEECNERTKQTYEEYERERNKTLEETNNH